MARRQYAGGAAQLTVNSGTVAAGDTSFTVSGTTTGWPDGSVGPFAVALNRGKPDEEKALCSARTGTTFTITTRGYDGTTAQSHANGTTVDLVITAVDADEANAHVNASSGVHGLTGSVVGTSDAQTLTNKTLSGGSLAGTIAGSPVLSGTPQFNANVKGSGGLVLTLPNATDTLVARTTTDTLTNKTLSAPTIKDGLAVPSNTSNRGLVVRPFSTGQIVETFLVQDDAGVNSWFWVDAQGATQVSPSLSQGNPALRVSGNVAGQNALAVVSSVALTADLVTFAPQGSTVLAVDKNGHLCGRGTTPGATAGAALGTSPPAITVSGNDQGGLVQFGTGTSPTTGALLTVTFNRPYAVAPASIQLQTQNNNNFNGLNPNVGAITTTGFTVQCGVAPLASQGGTTYRFCYSVMGG